MNIIILLSNQDILAAYVICGGKRHMKDASYTSLNVKYCSMHTTHYLRSIYCLADNKSIARSVLCVTGNYEAHYACYTNGDQPYKENI